MNATVQTHSKVVGYVLWIFGFTGSHRFYFGKPISGTIWFFTGGLLLIGWLIDVFLIRPWRAELICATPLDRQIIRSPF
jgi:TM2 domain-containing membrane protein YozV